MTKRVVLTTDYASDLNARLTKLTEAIQQAWDESDEDERAAFIARMETSGLTPEQWALQLLERLESADDQTLPRISDKFTSSGSQMLPPPSAG